MRREFTLPLETLGGYRPEMFPYSVSFVEQMVGLTLPQQANRCGIDPKTYKRLFLCPIPARKVRRSTVKSALIHATNDEVGAVYMEALDKIAKGIHSQNEVRDWKIFHEIVIATELDEKLNWENRLCPFEFTIKVAVFFEDWLLKRLIDHNDNGNTSELIDVLCTAQESPLALVEVNDLKQIIDEMPADRAIAEAVIFRMLAEIPCIYGAALEIDFERTHAYVSSILPELSAFAKAGRIRDFFPKPVGRTVKPCYWRYFDWIKKITDCRSTKHLCDYFSIEGEDPFRRWMSAKPGERHYIPLDRGMDLIQSMRTPFSNEEAAGFYRWNLLVYFLWTKGLQHHIDHAFFKYARSTWDHIDRDVEFWKKRLRALVPQPRPMKKPQPIRSD